MTNEKLALVIGAAGGVGFETARALIGHGWRVRALARDPSRGPRLPGAQWVMRWTRMRWRRPRAAPP